MINKSVWVTLRTFIFIIIYITATVSAVPIDFGQTLSGSLSAAETDTYTFTANDKDKIIIRVSKTSGAFQPGIGLYAPDGSKLQDMHNSPTAEISYELSGSGIYSISVYDSQDGTQTGNYNLYLQRAINPGNASPIGFGQTLSGSVAAAEMDAYIFTAKVKERVTIRVSKTSGTLQPGIRLYDFDGKDAQKSYGSSTAEIFYEISDGTWNILIYDEFDGAGSYDIYLGPEAGVVTPASAIAPTPTSTPIFTPVQSTIAPILVSTSAPVSTPVPSTYTPATADIFPPSISISKVIVDINKNGQLEEGEKLNITYGASDESGVESIKLWVDGELIEMRNKGGAYSTTTNPLSVGNHSIVIEAVDSKGNSKLEEMKFTVERTGPSVYFPKLRYEVNVGEDVNIILSAVNPIGNPKMEALLILKPPNNGVSIYESDCKGLAGMCTGKFEIEPGDDIRPVSVRMHADRPGEYLIGAEIYYRFDGGQRSPTLYENLMLVVKPALTSTSIQTEAQKPSIPGFGVLISIIALLIIHFKKMV